MITVSTEAEALDALNAVLAWTQQAPDSHHGDRQLTGLTTQRGRVIATWTHDGTVGASSYPDAEDASRKATEMEQSYRKWLAIRRSRVTVFGGGKLTVIEPPEEAP